MESEELRQIVLQVLKNFPKDHHLSIVSVIDAVESHCVHLDIYPKKTNLFWGGKELLMPREDREKVHEIVWQLIIEGVLAPGHDELNPNLPHIRVTDYGRECLQAGQVVPHDPDGYLAFLKREVPAIDPSIEMYVAESLQAYLRGLMLSSTVMLGCASEKAFLLLFDTYVSAIRDPNRKSALQNSQSAFIKKKFDTFRSDFDRVKGTLPKDLRDDIDLQIDAIFSLIRMTRNDAGHPSGRRIDRRLAYSNLGIFVPYVKRIYDLIDYFSKNPV